MKINHNANKKKMNKIIINPYNKDQQVLAIVNINKILIKIKQLKQI